MQGVGLRHLVKRCLLGIAGHHTGVTRARSQMSQQRSKTLDWQPVRRLVRLLLQARRLRGLRRQHWVATLTVYGQLLVLEQQRFPSPLALIV